MEPLDPDKTDENSRFSKRRISSILKAPRKSIILPEPVQHENTVECAQPVEKRKSRRVSFAAANDVLLFSKDVKNASPTRSPLQVMTTATPTTQNRVQVAVTEDGIQQITGMETLLNAPLHASQQRDTVNFDSGHGFGEKTMMFSTDDAFMDMTHSHSINIANNAELQQNRTIFSSGKKTAMFTADDASMDMTLSHTMNMTSGSESISIGRNMDISLSSSVPGLDREFENFLANLSKPSGSNVNPTITRMTPTAGVSSDATVETNSFLAKMKTQRAEMDKENQAPPSVICSSVMEMPQFKPRNIGESSYGGALCPEDDVSMEMTEDQTGRIVGFADEDDPFQCLFPTQEMYSRSDRASKSAENPRTSQQQSTKTQGSSDPAAVTTGNRVQEVITEGGSRHITDMTSLKNPSLFASRQSMSKVNFDTKDECREKTIRFTADDAFMDVTQSHTVNISSGPLAPQDISRSCRKMDHASSLEERRGATEKGFDPGFKNSLASLSKPSVNPARMVPTAFASSKETVDTNRSLAQLKTQKADVGKGNYSLNTTRSSRESPNGGTICHEDDMSMDMTEVQTGRIIGTTGTDDHLQCLFPTQDTSYPQSGNLKKMEVALQQQSSDGLGSSNRKGMGTSVKASLKTNVQRNQVKFDTQDDCREKTVRFTANDAAMDVTQCHTVNISTDLELQSHQNVDFLPTYGEKTVRFTTNDATMDVTQCHTINIATDLELHSHQNVDFLPTYGEKTVRFTTNDATMDVTQCHTVNISTDLELHSHQNEDLLPTSGEKTMRFTADDAAMDVTQNPTINITTDLKPQLRQKVACLPTSEKTVRFTTNDAEMDVTQSHTVNIATDLKPQLHQNVACLPTSGEKTVRFTANDAAIDVTQSRTVNIATELELQSHQNVDFLHSGGEKTMRFTANDAAMDMTQCITVNIANNLVSDSVLSQKQGPTILSTNGDFPLTVKQRGETSSSRRNRSSSALSLDSGFNNVLRRDDVNYENEAPSVVSDMEKSVNKTTKNNELSNSDHSEDVSIDMTQAQTGHILGETCTDEPPQCLSSTQDLHANFDHLNKTDITSQQSKEALGPSNHDDVEITNLPDSLDSNETETRNKPEPRSDTSPLSQKLKNSPSAVDVDAFPSRKSRRKSLADFQSKVRRLSHMINKSPDTIAMDSCTAPLPQLDHDMDKTKSLPVVEPELEMGLVNTEENTHALCPPQVEQPSTTTTPFKLKTKQLMSKLSMGGFKPKLPQRSKTPKKVDSSHVNSMGEHTRTITISVPNRLSNFDHDGSDINDEELGSFEDLSESLESSPQKVTEKVSPSQEFNMDELFEEDFLSAVHGKKRSLPGDENDTEDKKRMVASIETGVDIVETGLKSHITECDGNISAAPSMTTQTIDSSNSTNTASIRCEATFESTFKQSLFESQLEDCTSDVQKKLDHSTITVLEFFKLFNIDFVIHNIRQSVLPERLLSDTDRTPLDLLKDRHIIHPKQMVYETDVLKLTEQVERLEVRMQDLDKPLKIINRPLWEEMRNFSEKEFKTFGAKLKERNNFFRKTSKVQSHEMKEVLYSNRVQATREEQQKLSATIGKADEMIKSLDNCIHELETELAAVEEKGVDGKQSLKSYQEGLKQITETLADQDRQIAELEMKKEQDSSKLNRLKAETKNLQSHIDTLHMFSEWRFGEKKGNCTVYTFLYGTLHLQLVYENSNGNDVENETEQKLSDITFIFLELDDETSWCHTCLVHKLVSQYIEGETAWVKKYPTHSHVPKLLHNVSLVVSHCRLLGEELRLLKMWGGLRRDIVDISCVDTQVRILFSSLKAFSKFEVIFSVSLCGHLYVLQVQSFKSIIGSRTIQQIEEIVASISPARNLLTKIVKKIHENLLC